MRRKAVSRCCVAVKEAREIRVMQSMPHCFFAYLEQMCPILFFIIYNLLVLLSFCPPPPLPGRGEVVQEAAAADVVLALLYLVNHLHGRGGHRGGKHLGVFDCAIFMFGSSMMDIYIYSRGTCTGMGIREERLAHASEVSQ